MSIFVLYTVKMLETAKDKRGRKLSDWNVAVTKLYALQFLLRQTKTQVPPYCLCITIRSMDIYTTAM